MSRVDCPYGCGGVVGHPDSPSCDRPTTPRTEAGRSLLNRVSSFGKVKVEDRQWGSVSLRLSEWPAVILAIEREAVAAYVWERLEATPGFNEAMERGRADIKAGRLHRWEDIRRTIPHPDEE